MSKGRYAVEIPASALTHRYAVVGGDRDYVYVLSADELLLPGPRLTARRRMVHGRITFDEAGGEDAPGEAQ